MSKGETADEGTTEAAPAATAADGFDGLGLDERLTATLAGLGYEEPTPIQRETIPLLLTGRDLIGQAATGTGKTAAFALPMLQRIAGLDKAERGHPSALVLVPTRELAMQVAEAMHKYGQKLRLTTIPVYGGQSFGQQHRMLERGVDVVVATPGRALDHLRRETMDLSKLAILALDEADEMLDMGFADDLEAILAETPAERQTVLFSATLPPRIAGMTKKYMRDPLRIQIAKEPAVKGAAPKVRQTAYLIPRVRKLEVLGRVLDLENAPSALVFCRMRNEVDDLTERLNSHGYRAKALHGGIPQEHRSRVIQRLRDGSIDLVIATDVAARGLDIENLALVVNYDVPTSPEAYVHRIGRVGRAGREGIAVTLADPRESRLLRQFEAITKSKIEIAQVPTVADLRARRLELTRAAVREAIVAGGLDRYRVAVESLAGEHDLMDVALAAVKLAHEAAGGDKDDEQEEGDPFPDYTATGRRAGPPPFKGKGGDNRAERPDRPDRGDQADRPERADRGGGGGARPGRTARIYFGAGRNLGIRPQNLVGAIAGGSGLSAGRIGGIEIADRYSIVEIPEAAIEDVLGALRQTLIKGKKIPARRFVEAPTRSEARPKRR